MELLAAVLDRIDIGLCLVDCEDRVLATNRGWREVMGLPIDEAAGPDLLRLIPDSHAPLSDHYHHFRSGGSAALLRYSQTVEDEERWWEGTVSPIPMEGGEGFLLTVRDTTADVQAERERERLLSLSSERAGLAAELMQRNQRLATSSLGERLMAEEARRRAAELDAILASIADGLIIYRPTGDIARMNAAAERILGLFASDHENPLAGLTSSFRVEDGSGDEFAKSELPVWQALRGETVRGVVMVVRSPLRRSVRIRASAAPIRMVGGKLVGAVVTFTDITALHELQGQRDELIQLISQDLRAPLTVILGHAQMVQRAARKRGPTDKSIGAIAAEARRMNDMIQDLIDMAQLESGMLRLSRIPLDIHQFVLEVREWLGTGLEGNRLVVIAEGELPRVLADPILLERVLANLLRTALERSLEDTEVLVRLRAKGVEVETSVSWRGEQVPPDVLGLMFERFEPPEGGVVRAEDSNLGLYIGRMLVEAHGGRIWVEASGEGETSCCFTMPAVAREEDVSVISVAVGDLESGVHDNERTRTAG